MVKLLYILFNNNNPHSTVWEELDDIAFKALKESFINPHALGHPNDQISFFPFVCEKKENAL